MSDKAYITPKVLKWARESARMSEETAAAKANVSVDRLKEWEEGTEQPTIRQAQTLATAYKRPFALFFLQDIPRDFQPLQDFRKPGSKPLTTSSIFIIREIQQKQAWLRDLFKDNGEKALSFVGRFSLKDKPEVVANDILKTLTIHPAHYKTGNPLKEWIESAETAGIFISRTSFIHSRLKLDTEEIQGFAIADQYAPFVFLNSDDWNAPQLFTLVHELAHIWIAATGISNEVESDHTNKDKYHPVEVFCNQVAASALIPKEFVESLDPATFRSSKDVFKMARLLGISSLALILRAYHLNMISLSSYKNLKREADADFELFLQREEEKRVKEKPETKRGGPDYYLLQVNRNSRLFTQTVLDAFRGGQIPPTMASSLLNVQVNKFPKLEAQIK